LQIGGRLLIAKHLDQSLWFRYDWAIRNTEQQSDHIYFTLWACVCQALLCPLPASANYTLLLLGWNYFAEPNRHVYFSSSNFNLQVTCWVLSGVGLTIWCSLFVVLWRSTTFTVSFRFPSEWKKKLAWKLFHRPSILFHIYLDQAPLIAMSIQQIFGIICNKCSESQLFEHFTYWNLFTLPLTSIVEVKNGSKDKEILRIV
jgi:hypothetical protein